MFLRIAAVLLLATGFAAAPAASQLRADPHEETCEQGDSAACVILALMHELGVDVDLDRDEALVLYERACDSSEASGCTGAGLLLSAGASDVPRDGLIAEFYERGCALGDALACDLRDARSMPSAPGTPHEFFKSGVIVDGESGEVVDQVIVRLTRRGTRFVSDDQGRVELGRLPQGRHEISVEAFGYEPVFGAVDVPGNPIFLVGLTAADMDDPGEIGRVLGRVRDAESGENLSGVEVVAVNRDGRLTISNPEGRFELGLPPGYVEISVSRLGYATARTSVIVQPGAAVDVSVRLSTRAVELDAIDVSVAGGAMARTGFYDRRETGVGTYITADELMRTSPDQLSQALRGRTPGVRMMYGGIGPPTPPGGRPPIIMPSAKTHVRPVSFRRDFTYPCVLTVVVDEVEMPLDLSLDDMIAPEQIEAIEVYQGAGTPLPYAMTNPCGVIVIWSKR